MTWPSVVLQTLIIAADICQRFKVAPGALFGKERRNMWEGRARESFYLQVRWSFAYPKANDSNHTDYVHRQYRKVEDGHLPEGHRFLSTPILAQLLGITHPGVVRIAERLGNRKRIGLKMLGLEPCWCTQDTIVRLKSD